LIVSPPAPPSMLSFPPPPTSESLPAPPRSKAGLVIVLLIVTLSLPLSALTTMVLKSLRL
jgi:hypothetical protein